MNQSAFDSVAPHYDQVFTDSAVGRYQRSAVHRYLDRHVLFDMPLAILELGCGTGEDAVLFAERGHTVTATDLSPSMLALTQAKVEGCPSAERVRTISLDLLTPDRALIEGPFDLIFSNFGALNCVDEDALRQLAQFLAGLTRPGTHAVLVVMPRASLWESTYFMLRGRPRSACRRFNGGPVSAAVGGESVATWYHSPHSVSRAFQPNFRRRAIVPVGFAVPPSFLEPWAARHPRSLTILARIDQVLRSIGPLAALSDHALIHLERI